MNLLHAGPTWGDEFPVATSLRLADRVMLVSWEEHAANAAFVVTAHDRLPQYIADAEELDRRIETLADIAADPETNHATASVLRDAVKILRGET